MVMIGKILKSKMVPQYKRMLWLLKRFTVRLWHFIWLLKTYVLDEKNRVNDKQHFWE